MTERKKKQKVLFAAFEAVPFAKTGGLGDVAGSLPRALNGLGADVRVILPKLDVIPEKFKAKMKHVADFYLDLSWRHQYCGIERLTYKGVKFYFIDNEYYFCRGTVYGEGDDWERAAFFAKAVLESLRYLDFKPEIIHLNDWHTALIPAFYKRWYSAEYPKLKTVVTVHNLKFQGVFSGYLLGDGFGMSVEEGYSTGLLDDGNVNYLKSALRTADKITTVSPTYAKEICTDFYGEGAQWIFKERSKDLEGILNGIDTDVLNPETDKNIPVNYNVKNFSEGKPKVKEALQKKLGLEVTPEKPIFAIISRLTGQKGLDLVLAIIDEFMQEDVQFVVLGVGEKVYQEKFGQLALSEPSKFAAQFFFDEGLSRMIYAGADFILVPSLFEPCGLTQITAMRYGTLPIVRETGGLKDSVKPYDPETGTGTGFTFPDYNAHELLFKMKDAMELYRTDKKVVNKLITQAMKEDFSWGASAKKYLKLYESLS